MARKFALAAKGVDAGFPEAVDIDTRLDDGEQRACSTQIGIGRIERRGQVDNTFGHHGTHMGAAVLGKRKKLHWGFPGCFNAASLYCNGSWGTERTTNV